MASFHRIAVAICLLLSAVCGACSSNKSEAPPNVDPMGGAPDGGRVECAKDSDPQDTYVANLRKEGRVGVLSFTLISSDPAPPPLGKSLWTLEVARVDGQLLTGTLTSSIKMPYHSHPVVVQPAISFDAASQTYAADPIYFFMAGYWAATFSFSDEAENVIDAATFYFCVE